MALPKIKTTNYELDLPSSGEKIKFRPWLIKEQKVLMMAQEAGDEKELERAFANIVSECTFGEIDPYKNPMFDIEYVFLQLRSKAVGDKIDLSLLCPDDEKTRVKVQLDTKDIGIQMKEEHTNIIEINDTIKIVMRYPNLKDMSGFDDKGQVKQMFSMISNCVHEIHDGTTIHARIDMSDSELEEFIDSMSQDDFEKMTNFFETMPKLQHVIEVTNPKTKKTSEVVLEGVQSFFE
jgi:hypothetical protein